MRWTSSSNEGILGPLPPIAPAVLRATPYADTIGRSHTWRTPRVYSDPGRSLPEGRPAVPDDVGTELAEADELVEDDAAIADADSLDVLPRFEITAYGADYPVDALVKRYEDKDIEIPQWQRGWVWSPRDAARFVESLLLGLPVPGIFLYQEPSTRKLLVVDGQQRLRSLVAYYNNDLGGRPFRLPERPLSRYQPANPDFAGRSYKELQDSDRRSLDNQIIHATVVKQDNTDGASSIYHVFERINSTGVRLQPQEIRSVIYRGTLDDLLQGLNKNTIWRQVYGQPSKHLKDQELILRFIALLDAVDSYERPMADFLNTWMQTHRNTTTDSLEALRATFDRTIAFAWEAVGQRVFRPETTLNAAVFDAVMVGLARGLSEGPSGPDPAKAAAAYDELLASGAFRASYLRATSDTAAVKDRVRLATEAFAQM